MPNDEAYPLDQPPDELGSKLGELGAPLAEFAVTSGRFLRSLILAPILFLLGWAVILLLTFFAAQKLRASVGKLFFVGIILIVGAVVMAIRAFRNRGLRVLIFPEGLVRFQGEQTKTFFWDQVVSVCRRKSKSNWHHGALGTLFYDIELQSGETMQFNDYLPDLKRLGGLIEQHTLPHLLPPAQAAFDEGATVVFGSLRLNRDGLAHKNQTLPWDQVKSIEIGDQVTIKRQNKWSAWCTLSTMEVPNSHVLRAVADRVLGKTEVNNGSEGHS
jgi:hypothetical protein